MIREIVMPKLGQTMEEASIEAWRVKEGDTVQKGDVLLEINTDKAALEVESFYAGVVKKLLYAEGDTVPCNAAIAFLGDPDDEVTDDMVQAALARAKELAAAASAPAQAPAAPAPATPQPAPSARQAAPVAAAPEPPAGVPPIPAAPAAVGEAAIRGDRIFASPRARRVAAEQRVPLQVLRGSGPNGRIVEADVLAYAERVAGLRVSPAAREIAWQRGVDLTRVKGSGTDGRIMAADVEKAPVAGTRRVPLTAMRRVVAQRMTLSKTTTPHFYLTMDVDMTALVAFRAELQASSGRRISFNDFFARACAMAFAEVPEMNCAWGGDAILYRGEVNIGIAVGLEGGLIVPVVRGCESKSLLEIAAASEELIARARNKRLTPDDYEGGCITLSNLGMFGVDSVVPIINPGEAAILGIGRIAKRPVAVGDGVAVRQMTTLVLACDHRLVDGVIGARFLRKVKQLLEEPKSLA